VEGGVELVWSSLRKRAAAMPCLDPLPVTASNFYVRPVRSIEPTLSTFFSSLNGCKDERCSNLPPEVAAQTGTTG
jgi:hypothetical protein